MIEIFEKRGSWCYRDADGKLFKFATEAEAKNSLLGLEKDNGSEKEKDQEESSAEETSATSFGIGKKDTSSKGKKK